MRVTIFAVGRMKSGPERELAQRYLDRFAKAGSALGLDFAGTTEIVESRASSADARKAEESRKLIEIVQQGGVLVLLDERGRPLDSPAFAGRLAHFRDEGRKEMILALGGPDGHDPQLREHADLVLSLGAMTWPHQIARILLAEQLYRAVTILSGHPYHRS